MTSWLHRLRTEIDPPQTQRMPQTPVTPRTAARTRDPNSPDYRYNINQKCIYERRLPGGSYITAHVQRLQSGYYDSPMVHEDLIENVRFVAINFVFHPSRSSFRFKSAEISLALHNEDDDRRQSMFEEQRNGITLSTKIEQGITRNALGQQQRPSTALIHHPNTTKPPARQKSLRTSPPRFLRHAPHLLFGAISPETLNWNFNLAGSLGVSQGPANATLSPSGGRSGSYKMYEMMRIQGSVRGLHSWFGRRYDVEDGEIVWTLEENKLQKSGLPREFTFVVLLTKGSGVFEEGLDVNLDIDIKPVVAGFLGMGNASYPDLITNALHYKPLHKDMVDLDEEIGQRFQPEIPGKGFNFAELARSFDEFVWLPGTTWSADEHGAGVVGAQVKDDDGKDGAAVGGGGKDTKGADKPKQLPAAGDNTLNLRVILDSSTRAGSPLPALSYMNLRTQPPYPISRGPSPLNAPPAARASTTPSTANQDVTAKRRSITIVSSLRPSRSTSKATRPTNPTTTAQAQKSQKATDSSPAHRSRQSRSPTLRRRTSRSSLDKEFRSSFSSSPSVHRDVTPPTAHSDQDEPAVSRQQSGVTDERPNSWLDPATPSKSSEVGTDEGTVIHHQQPRHEDGNGGDVVSTERYNQYDQPPSNGRVKTRQSKVAQTPYPTLLYGDESEEGETHTVEQIEKDVDVPVIAVPRKSSRRVSAVILNGNGNVFTSSDGENTGGRRTPEYGDEGNKRHTYHSTALNAVSADVYPYRISQPTAAPPPPAQNAPSGHMADTPPTTIGPTKTDDHLTTPPTKLYTAAATSSSAPKQAVVTFDKLPTSETTDSHRIHHAQPSAPSSSSTTTNANTNTDGNIYASNTFARSASGVFVDAEESLPLPTEAGIHQHEEEGEGFDVRNVI